MRRGPRSPPGPHQSTWPSRPNPPFGLGKDRPFGVCGRALPGATIRSSLSRAPRLPPSKGGPTFLVPQPRRGCLLRTSRGGAFPEVPMQVSAGSGTARCPETSPPTISFERRSQHRVALNQGTDDVAATALEEGLSWATAAEGPRPSGRGPSFFRRLQVFVWRARQDSNLRPPDS